MKPLREIVDSFKTSVVSSKRSFLPAYLVLLIIGLWFITAVPTHAQTPPAISLEAYWQAIENAQSMIAELSEAEPDARQLGLAALANELEQITAVSLPDGRVIPVSPTHLANSLRREEPDFIQINKDLGTLLAAKNHWPESQLTSLDDAALSQILSRPEFQYDSGEPNAIQRFFQEVRRRFFEFLSNLLPDEAAGVPLGDLITFASVIALAILLGYIFLNLYSGFTLDADLGAGGAEDGEILTADVALQRAQTLSGGGDYRTAVRYLYLSSLLLLEEHGLLRYDRSLTNREYLRSVSNKPRLAKILRDVIDVFDRVWYGFQPIAEDEYDIYAQQVEKLKKQRDES